MALWITLFCFSTIAGLLFQKLLLPLVPSLHGGYGLLTNDAVVFHHIAESIANDIHLNGWSFDVLWLDTPCMSGNIAILAVLYVLFGPYPSLILPINAAFHALSGCTVVLYCPGNMARTCGQDRWHYYGNIVCNIPINAQLVRTST
jgi:hypothetical protein